MVLFVACSSKKEANAIQDSAKDQSKNTTSTPNASSDNELAGIDTAAFFKKYPNIKKDAKGTPYDTLSLKKQVLLMEAREFFSNSQFQLGSFGDQFISFLKTNQGRSFNKNFTLSQIKFQQGKSDITGNYAQELTEFGHATYSSVNLFFKINVNEKDSELRKAKLNSLKTLFKNSKVDVSRVEFDEASQPIGKSDEITVSLYQKLPKKTSSDPKSEKK